MRILKTLLLPFLLILSLIGVDRPKVWKHPSPPVGASLLAMTTAQPILRPTEPPLSRASSLPQGVGVHSGLER